ncbi:hypothetical protein BST61_g5273 [Cercospora zeina]
MDGLEPLSADEERGEARQPGLQRSATTYQADRTHFESSAMQLNGQQTPSQATFTHARHLLLTASSPQSRKAFQLGSSDESDAETPGTRPTTASPAVLLNTPRRHRRTEIPSSQTPPSIHLSSSSHIPNHHDRLSPLQERSLNSCVAKSPSTTLSSPETSSGRHELDPTNWHSDTGEDPDVDIWTTRPILTPRKQRKSEVPIRKRQAVQKNDDDEARYSDSESEQPSHRSILAQESQDGHNTEDLEITDDGDVDAANMLTGTYDPMFQDTFDPTAAALERDASRFGQDATQSAAPVHPLRASQISTVMPTQRSRPGSSHEEMTLGEFQQPDTMAAADTTASASFPLPPCDELLMGSHRVETLGSDVSLPPPPSTFSARRDPESTM